MTKKDYRDLPDGTAPRQQKAAKCRIVLFCDGQGEEVPAIITKALGGEHDTVNLTVFVSRETGTGWIDGVPFGDGKRGHACWRWPDRDDRIGSSFG